MPSLSQELKEFYRLKSQAQKANKKAKHITIIISTRIKHYATHTKQKERSTKMHL